MNILFKKFIRGIIFICCCLCFLQARADEFEEFLKRSTSRQDKTNVETSTSSSSLPEVLESKPSPQPDPNYQKKLISKVKNWAFLWATPRNEKVYYAVNYAKRRLGNVEKKEGVAYFMVHYFNPYKRRVSVFFNYNLKPESTVLVSVDGTQFNLKPINDSYAAASDADTDAAVISALLNAKRVLIRGEGEGNTYSVDEYEVAGFPEIYVQMKKKFIESDNIKPKPSV